MSDYKRLFCNAPAAMHLPGKLILMPGPNGHTIPIAAWEAAKQHGSVQRAVRAGELTGDGYRPMVAKRPRKVANPVIDLDAEKAQGSAPASRRAREPMVVGGAPDRDLVAEIEGMPTSTEIAADLADLQERAAMFNMEMSEREAAIRREAAERIEAERKAADERLEALRAETERERAALRAETERERAALRAETERELASMRARIKALGATPTPPDPTPVPDEPAGESDESDGPRAGRRRRG